MKEYIFPSNIGMVVGMLDSHENLICTHFDAIICKQIIPSAQQSCMRVYICFTPSVLPSVHPSVRLSVHPSVILPSLLVSIL